MSSSTTILSLLFCLYLVNKVVQTFDTLTPGTKPSEHISRSYTCKNLIYNKCAKKSLGIQIEKILGYLWNQLNNKLYWQVYKKTENKAQGLSKHTIFKSVIWQIESLVKASD